MSELFAHHFAGLTKTLSRALLRYGQTPAVTYRATLIIWPLCIVALLLAFLIWPAQGRIHALESTLNAHTMELQGLDERLREAQALTRALHAITTSGTAAAAPQSTQDPWPFLQGLAQARAVHLLDYTPLPASHASSPEPDCQRLRLKTNGASIAVQGLLHDLLHSPQILERFTMSPNERGSTTLSLQICIRGAESHPAAQSFPSAPPFVALFQPAPKVVHTPRTVLEEHPLSAYRVIAVGRAAHDHYALLRTPAGKIHTIRPRMPIGNQGGQVIAILPNGIEVQQDNTRQSLLIGNLP